MAASSRGRTEMNSSAVVDMETGGTDESDYEVNFSDAQPATKPDWSQKSETPDTDLSGNIKTDVAKGMASYMWEEGRQRASRAFSLYANIDVLRPYYDVEPHEVKQRLLSSLIPHIPSRATSQQEVPRELYGPTMLVLTLIALLLFQMKTANHLVQEGTLMGTAFGTCFGYWLGFSGCVWVMAYICSTRISMLQILNLLGYALFGHCIVLLISTLVHPSNSHLVFYISWLTVGGLSTLRVVSVLVSRTSGSSRQLIVSLIIVLIHLLFLMYLHFAYHKVVQDLSDAIQGSHHRASVRDNDRGELDVQQG